MFTTTQEKERYKFIILGVLLVLTIFIRLPILSEPWGSDQAGFGHVAKGMLEGNIPYKDFYSLTAYGVFFAYVLLFKLFGMSMVSIHIGHIIMSVISVILVFYLTYRLYGMRTAVIASLCYTIFSNGLAFSGFGYENKSAWGTYWYISQREVFMAPLITGAVFLMVINEKKDNIYVHLINGILIGLAAFFKLTAVLMLFLFIAFIIGEKIINRRPAGFAKISGNIFCLVFGFIAIQLPFLYYFWIHDALKDMYMALFVHLSTYAKLSRGLRIEAFFSGNYSVMSENLVLWLFSAISCLYIIFKDRNRNNILIMMWCVVSLIMVWGQGKFFGYHFIILVPPFAVLTGYGLMKFLGDGQGLKGVVTNNLRDIKKVFMLAVIVFGIVAFCTINYDYYKRHAQYFTGKISKQEYYKVFEAFPTHPYSFSADYQIVEYLRNNAEEGDKLGVIFSAGDTIIHFLTGMEPATRFIQSWYLFSSNEVLSRDEMTIDLRREFIDQIINIFPRYILVVHIPLEELVELPYVKDDPNVGRLHEFITRNYSLKNFPSNRFLFQRVDSVL